jgi:FO synthase
VYQGANTLGLSLDEFLGQLKDAGLGSLPGTAAEILDDEVRAILCPDKVNTSQWLEVIETAHNVGLKTTSTIMFGHVETPAHWARHLVRVRDLQSRTGGITEFVPLPFVHMEAPIFLKGGARRGPSWRETVLIHSVSRLALHPLIQNIQTSWVKLGPIGASICLEAGANDLGGTLMNETITRSAGASHGQELPPVEMDALIKKLGRDPSQRSTLYGNVNEVQEAKSYKAMPLDDVVNNPVRKYSKKVKPQFFSTSEQKVQQLAE